MDVPIDSHGNVVSFTDDATKVATLTFEGNAPQDLRTAATGRYTVTGSAPSRKLMRAGEAAPVALEAPASETAPELSGLPAGGTEGQVLTKASSTDGDADWEDAASGASVPTPASGDAGKIVTVNEAEDGYELDAPSPGGVPDSRISVTASGLVLTGGQASISGLVASNEAGSDLSLVAGAEIDVATPGLYLVAWMIQINVAHEANGGGFDFTTTGAVPFVAGPSMFAFHSPALDNGSGYVEIVIEGCVPVRFTEPGSLAGFIVQSWGASGGDETASNIGIDVVRIA